MSKLTKSVALIIDYIILNCILLSYVSSHTESVYVSQVLRSQPWMEGLKASQV